MSVPHAICRPAAECAFDALAPDYDEIFTRSLIGRAQRHVVWQVMGKAFKRGDHILEINCGTGEDALFLARSGMTVLACDASQTMIAVATRRQAAEAPDACVQFEIRGIDDIDALRTRHTFDGVLSNFSGLNCVEDPRQVAQALATLVKRGGCALICVSTRYCAWETAWFLSHGKFRQAFRRWSGRATCHVRGFDVEVRYPTVTRLCQMFSPSFVLRSYTGIGVAIPPSYVEAWAKAHPTAFAALRGLDETINHWPGLRAIGDHVLLVFERTGQ